MTLFSIICTVKNGETTLTDTIDSVINQSLNSWEFIIVDDGSTDNTTEILLRYQKNDDRIKVISTKGVGRAKALNIAIKNAKGSYICNIDADDLFHPDKLKMQQQCIAENPDYFLIATESIIIQDQQKPIWQEYKSINNIDIKEINHTILVKNQINHSSVVMKSDILKQLGGYNEKRKSQFDYELWLRAFMENKKLGKINYKLTAKRIHKKQSYENKKRIVYLYRSIKLQMDYIIKSKQKWYYLFIPPIRLILGLLPFRVRDFINKSLKK